MKKIRIIIIICILLALTIPIGVLAQSAVTATWTSSITYYTPSSEGGDLLITYYNGATTYVAGPLTLDPHKAGSLFIGNTTVPNNFAGSAVLSSNVPVMATYVQFASGSDPYGRLLYTGFENTQASDHFYLPTFLYDTGDQKYISKVGVQNIESFEISARLELYPVGSSTPITKTVDILPSASYIFTGADISGLPNPFSGSLVVIGVKKGTTDPGKVVAISEELQVGGRRAYAFEGTSQGASTLYMPSMMCQAGSTQQTSYYAIQNTEDPPATVTITYYDTNGDNLGQYVHSSTIPKGGKASLNPCMKAGMTGKSGSAVITSDSGQKLLAIGKVLGNDGLLTAFVGQASGTGYVVLPYVRWAADATQDFRSYIAVMNIGSQATDIKARYYNASGTMVAEHVLASVSTPLNQYIKRNTNAQGAGALTSGSFGLNPSGGAVEIISDQPVVVTVRAVKAITGISGITTLGEDYNGVPYFP